MLLGKRKTPGAEKRKQYSEYRFGDMTVTWWLDEQNHMGMTLIPAGMKDQLREHQ